MIDELREEMDNVVEAVDQRELTPQQYFDMIKEKKHTMNDQALVNLYDNCLSLLNKYKKTNQVKAMKKLIFHLENLEKERRIVQAGVTTFVYRDDIEEFIDSISKQTVKIIELENYEREIPDEIVDVVDQVGGMFDKLYVLFTDYTGKVERQVQKERREKDPILFGTFQDTSTRSIVDRFYFLGDWEDEYCDLTLDKMVAQFQEKKSKNVAMEINTPEDIEELKLQLEALQPSRVNQNLFVQTTNVEKPEKPRTWFSNVKSIFKKKQ